MVFGGEDSGLPTLKKKGTVPNQRGFRGLKKGFVLSTELKNGFVHSTKP